MKIKRRNNSKSNIKLISTSNIIFHYGFNEAVTNTNRASSASEGRPHNVTFYTVDSSKLAPWILYYINVRKTSSGNFLHFLSIINLFGSVKLFEIFVIVRNEIIKLL